MAPLDRTGFVTIEAATKREAPARDELRERSRHAARFPSAGKQAHERGSRRGPPRSGTTLAVCYGQLTRGFHGANMSVGFGSQIQAWRL